MEQTIRQQFAIFEEMQRSFRNYKKDGKDRKTISYINIKLEMLDDNWREFRANHRKLASSDTAQTLSESLNLYFTEEYLTKVEEFYIEAKSYMQTDLAKRTSKVSTNTVEASKEPPSINTKLNLKLPKIDLPKFNGEYKYWKSFCDLFVTLIHENDSISSVQKLHYLKSSLQGEAAQLLRNFTITSNNYLPAWNLLLERFDNTRMLMKTQLHILFNQPFALRDTAASVRKLVDTTIECTQALQNLNANTEDWDIVLTHIVSERLPPETKKLWEQRIGSRREFPKFSELQDFLESQFRALESLGTSSGESKSTTSKRNFQIVKRENGCVICKADHSIRKCPKFLNLEHSAKRDIVLQKNLCSNCLSRGHHAKQCPSKGTCFSCGHRHHTLLHNDNLIADKTKGIVTHEPITKPVQSNTEGDTMASTSQSQVHVGNISVGSEVLLATAMLKLVANNGMSLVVRALIDQGSQATFVSETVAQKLNLKGTPIRVNVSGLGNIPTGVAKSQLFVTIYSLTYNFKINSRALVLNNLNSILPTQKIKGCESWNHLQGLKLADPNYRLPGKIDMIIGADVYSRIILDGLKFGPKGSPIAQRTTLGWILSGEVDLQPKEGISIAAYYSKLSLDEQMRKFWEIEEMQPAKHLTEEELECEDLYAKTTTRRDDGRYVVHLPFQNNILPALGESRSIALSRFRNLESSFNKSTTLRTEYSKNIKEYATLHHMELASSPNINQTQTSEGQLKFNFCYLPHHAVFKNSTTTSLRVVFDASAKTVGGPSLNDVMLTGPTLQDSLLSIILRWRKYKIVLTADIEKMYRQIWVKDEHTEYQRILWRSELDNVLKEYRLKTVTFGTTAAPYLAIRTLHQLACDEEANYPLVADVLRSDFYVDDLLTGCQSVDVALTLRQQLTALLKSGGFNLRKWGSNKREVLENLPEEIKESENFHNLSFEESLKTLGIQWHPNTDSFSYVISNFNSQHFVTKRTFLSDISKLFDPLGLLSPITIKTKILMQELWQSGVDWDDKIPDAILYIWWRIKGEFKAIEHIKVPRWICTISNVAEMHGFCDGSSKAYAAVIYFRVVDHNGHVRVTLLASKTRVTPTKPVSTPRSELCGAVLLTRLFKLVRSAMKFDYVNFKAWSDSTIVLSWIRNHPGKYKTFVANRIAEIQETLDPSVWSYVPTGSNPADCASRGLFPNELLNHSLWWKGPEWLLRKENHWPTLPNLKESNLEEKGVKLHFVHMDNEDNVHQLINKYSSITRLIRITAYIFRFVHRCKSTNEKRRVDWLTTEELTSACEFWIKITQMETFSEDIKAIQLQKVPITLANLTPFIDGKGILRVGGRLQNTSLSWNEQHPIILPSKHHFTNLIIDDMHKRTLHGGAQLILSLLRRKYWILRARNIIRLRIHKCIICFRQRSQTCQQLMGSLPKPRITVSKPFTHVGIDYCGPFDIKTSKLRNARKIKCYLAIFICFAVKAVHIETVSDLSTDAFLAAFRRFIARRGLPTDLYSDNATNFVGAKNTLETYHAHIKELSKTLPAIVENENIKWHFIPPAAPHFGGLWESAVRSTKYHLKRLCRETSLTFEEFATLSSQVEACLNSRPICPISNDPSDLTALTPGHFLIGAPIMSIPEPMSTSTERNMSPLNRWQYIQSIMQNFWNRWKTEYIGQLQQRPKWNKTSVNVKKGDLVLVKDDKTMSCHWPLGRIMDVHPGPDGLVRVATVRTKNFMGKRPITKLCLLPIEENLDT